jgi:hypothetical protein
VGNRLTVVLEDGAGEKLLELAGSSRKQGEYLSKLISTAYQAEQDARPEGVEIESLRLQLVGLAGEHRALAGRVLQLEKQIAALALDSETANRPAG